MATLFAVGNVIQHKTTNERFVVVQTPVRMKLMDAPRTTLYALRTDSQNDRPTWWVLPAKVVEAEYTLVRADRRE